MKKILSLTFLLLMLTELVSFSGVDNGTKSIKRDQDVKAQKVDFTGLVVMSPPQDRQQVAFENMVSELRNLHGAIFTLPYSDDMIRNTLIPEVNAQRLVLAPHYPERQTYGDNGEMAYQLLKIWFETYPQECQTYIEFLKSYIAAHSN